MNGPFDVVFGKLLGREPRNRAGVLEELLILVLMMYLGALPLIADLAEIRQLVVARVPFRSIVSIRWCFAGETGASFAANCLHAAALPSLRGALHDSGVNTA